MSNPNDLLEASGSRIPQPELRPLGEKERYVRTAGLRFIIPENFSPGDVLDDNTAAILNAAWTTQVINRFSPIRQALLENPATTYADIDRELQSHFNSYVYRPRPVRAPGDEDETSDADRDLISFARPVFNKHFGGQGLDRKDYEALLKTWVKNNREMLVALKTKSDDRAQSLASDFLAAFGQD